MRHPCLKRISAIFNASEISFKRVDDGCLRLRLSANNDFIFDGGTIVTMVATMTQQKEGNFVKRPNLPRI